MPASTPASGRTGNLGRLGASVATPADGRGHGPAPGRHRTAPGRHPDGRGRPLATGPTGTTAPMSIFSNLLRAGEGRKVKALRSLVPEINALEPEVQALGDDALRHKTVQFRERLGNGEELDDLLVESFAVVREAARRVIGQRHFDVQLMGGAALHFGWIAEMRTGEGKTLVSTLPAYLNGLSGRGMHLITVNDYLAKRDSEWMGAIHKWLGLSVGLVIPELDDPETKRRAYACANTYGTTNELAFDYL